ncbi:CRE-SRU-29 protein [Caenorhabditis remanei]|uniref:CRE-SRU-29 protein n=1 Tax=Caenorhabditis remanei TaxID=31234 RepID=E3MHL3_CAERE|nr:CRE-SRU-29 protein [Caenorhabditis remanei]
MSSSSQIMPSNDSIHGIQAYKNFVPVFNFTTFQAFLPLIYILPTIFVMLTILIKYRKAKATLNSNAMDHNIFAFIMFYFLFNMLFFFGDYFHLNLPTTGFVTSWCAGIEPSRVFSVLLVFAYYSNFGTIICPFLVCLMRLTIMMSPRHNERVCYCRLIMYRFAIPFLFLVPICLTAFNLFSTGYCMQLHSPFSFGSIIIFEGEDYAKINIIIHFSFSCIMFSSNVGMTTFMFYKLRMTQSSTTSERTKQLTRKAEFSLFLAVVSSVIPFTTNSICSVSFLFDRPLWDYVLFLRAIGNDYETVMMPWVLFLTHPMFRSKKKTSSTNATSNMFATSNTNSQSRKSAAVVC